MFLSKTNQGLSWLTLQVPVHRLSISIIQQALLTVARSWQAPEQRINMMELAIEESFMTILQLIHGQAVFDENVPAVGEFEVEIRVAEGVLQVRISDDDLPYDFSMLPQFSPQQIALDNTDGLSVFLLHNICDEVKVLPPSIHGQSLLLQWQLPPQETIELSNTQTEETKSLIKPTIELRQFVASDAIYLARLMHQNYGYSYVNADLYIAEKIRQRSGDGRLFSHVAVTEQDELVGHCALMKSHADDEVVELGAAVVSPHYQGLGIFNRLWGSLEQLLPQRQEKIACVHAVSSHPYTQKIVLHHGYVMCALMLGYTPNSMQLKNMHHLSDKERGSVFYCCKLLHPMPAVEVYLPQAERAEVLHMAQALGMALHEQQALDKHEADLHETTHVHYHLETSLNIAYLYCSHWQTNSMQTLRQHLRQLCRARVDVVYAVIDLSQHDAPWFYDDLVELGFITGGFAPFMPYAASLLMQYTNNLTLHESSVCAVGAEAERLKQQVFAAYRQQECLEENE